MGNEMGNNNTTGILHESDDTETEVQEKSLQQPIRNDDEVEENLAVPASENINIDVKETILASNDSVGKGHANVPDKSSNQGKLNVKEADFPAANHKNEQSIGEAVNDEDSEIQSYSLAKELEDHEKPTEPLSVSEENHLETSHKKLQKQVSFSKDNATSEAQEKSLQKPVPENDAKGESHVAPSSENKNIDEKETFLASKDSNGTKDDHARSKVSDAEEPNVTKADPSAENNKTEMRIDDDGETKSTSLAKELKDHEKSTEEVQVSNEYHLETNNQIQKQASFRKEEEDGMLTESCVTTSLLQNSESQVLIETNFEEIKLAEIHADQSEQLSGNSEIKVDDDLGSNIENNPVKENGHRIDTSLTNMDETVVSGTDLDVEEKKEELSATKMTSQKSEMQFEVKSDGNEGEFMSTTIVSLNSASDDTEKCDGKSINEVKTQENNGLHQEVMANSENSFVEDLPEDKCMILTRETKLVKKDSETEGNKQDQNNAQSNEELVIQSKTDKTNVSDNDFLLSPDGKNEEKKEPDSNSSDPSGNKDFQKQENVADSGNSIEASEENYRESEGENVNVTELGMLPPELCIPSRGENAVEEKEFKTEEQEEIRHKPEAASLNEEEIKKSENIEYWKFQSIPDPVHSEPSPSDSLIHCQDSQQEIAILSNGSQSSSNLTLELKPERSSELPDTKPTIFHGRSLTVDFLGSAIEIAAKKPMPVDVNSVSANPEMVLEDKSSSSSHQSIDRYDVEASLQVRDSFAEAAESAERSSTESNPNGFNVQMRKSPSFSLDLCEEERSGESDRTPLLYQDKTTIKSSQSGAAGQYPLLESPYVQQSLENQTMEVEEKVITLDRSDSEKSRTPFLEFFKQDEEDHIVVTPKKQENQSAAKNSNSDYCNSVTKEVSSSPAKPKEKLRKSKSSLFTNCMCCTTAIN